MSSLRTIVEFQENLCRLFIWETVKGTFVLKSFVKFPIEKFGEKHEDSESNQATVAALRQAVRATGYKISEAVVVIPKQWVTVRAVTLPSTEPAELADMARFEAQRYIPFNVERHIISHHILRMEGLAGSRVIVAAIDGPPADEIVATMEGAGIRITALEVSTIVLVNALNNSGQWNSESNPTVAHIEIGETATDINILHKGNPVFARSIAHGIDKLFANALSPDGNSAMVSLERIEAIDLLRTVEEGKAETVSAAPTPEAQIGVADSATAQLPHIWAERLVNEIRRTYDFARREFECDPLTQIFVSGVGAGLGNIDQILRSNVGVEPIVLNPFSENVQMGKEVPGARQKPFVYTMGVGGIVREASEKSLRINLLPPLYVRRSLTTQRKRSLIVTGSLVLAFLLCAAIFASLLVTRRQRELNFFETQIAATKERAKEIGYRKAVINILKANTSSKGSALAVLDTISGYNDLFNPNNMRTCIESFSYKSGETVGISGYAINHEDLNNFVSRLEASGHFAKVRIDERPPSSYPGKAEEVLKFSVTCVFKQTGSKDTQNTAEKKGD